MAPFVRALEGAAGLGAADSTGVSALPAASIRAAGDALVIRIHPDDDVVIARQQLVGGTRIESEGITVSGLVPPGHKVATRAIAAGEPVRRYDQIIGTAKQAIAPGQHVHTHNLEFSSFARDYAAASGARPTDYVAGPATFDGIVRADGRIATRNYVGILTSVNCSATVARAIADHFRRDTNPKALERFPNVDGVIALTHGAGCATDSAGEPLQVLRRTLGGYARHPNFASVLVVGLGCETNQISGLLEQEKLGGRRAAARLQHPGDRRHEEDRRARHRARRVAARGSEPGDANAGAGEPHHGRPAVRRLRTATRASAPTRRSAPRSTGWCATAAPRSFPRRPRSTAASTC